MRSHLGSVRLATAAIAASAIIATTQVGAEAPFPDPASSLGADDFKSLAETTPAFAGGGLEVVHERYPNGKTKIERNVVLDLTGNYVNHGQWKYLDPKGNVVAEGQFDMGKRIGLWTRWHGPKDSEVLRQYPLNKFKPPFRSQATFVDDQMSGEWLIVDSAQRKCMQVSLNLGKRNGITTVWLPNGNVFSQATYDEGVRVGDVLEADRKGELKRIATYIDGRSITTKGAKGRGKNKKSEEQFLGAPTVQKAYDDFWTFALAEYAAEGEDVRHGPSMIWFDNGQLQQQGFYQHGRKAGTFTFHYDNGQVAATGDYKDDLPVGPWVWSHRNGQKATTGEYSAGEPVGQWRWWKEDGTLANEKSYDTAGSLAEELPKDVEAEELPKDVEVEVGQAPVDEAVR